MANVNQDKGNLSRYLRNINFIHKTAMEFVKNQVDLFGDPDRQLTGMLAAIRGQIAVANLVPDLTAERGSAQSPLFLNPGLLTDLMGTFGPSAGCSPAMNDAAIQIVDQVYDLIVHLNTSLNEPNQTISDLYDEVEFDKRLNLSYTLPFEDRLGFAAFFGRNDYVTQNTAGKSWISQVDVEFILHCALLSTVQYRRIFINHFQNERIKGLFNILLDYIPRTRISYMSASTNAMDKHVGGYSEWTFFVVCTLRVMIDMNDLWQMLPAESLASEQLLDLTTLCGNVIRSFLDHNAIINPNILFTYLLEFQTTREDANVWVTVDETLLASIKRRKLPRTDLPKVIEDLLCDRGGTHRRIFSSVEYFNQREEAHLTQDQSERLLHAYPSERLKCSQRYEWGIFLGLGQQRSMPTEPDPEAEEIVNLLLDEPWDDSASE